MATIDVPFALVELVETKRADHRPVLGARRLAPDEHADRGRGGSGDRGVHNTAGRTGDLCRGTGPDLDELAVRCPTSGGKPRPFATPSRAGVADSPPRRLAGIVAGAALRTRAQIVKGAGLVGVSGAVQGCRQHSKQFVGLVGGQ